MKKILLFLIVLLSIQCSQKDGTAVPKTKRTTTFEQLPIIIAGERTNESKIKSYLLTSKFGDEKITLDSNKFKIKITNNQPMVLRFSVRGGTHFPLFVLPGDSLHMIFREKDIFNEFNEITFSGGRVVENKLFYDLHNVFNFDIGNRHYFYNFPESTFLHQIDSLEQLGKTFIHRVQKEHPNIHPLFVEAMQQFVQSNLALYLENYPKIAKGSFRRDEVIKSDSYLQKEATLFVEDENLMNHSAYLSLLKHKTWNAASAIYYRKNLAAEGMQHPNLEIKFPVIDSIFQNKNIQDYLKFEMLRGEMYNIGNDVGIFLEKYRQGNPAEHYLKILDKQYAKYVENFSEKMVLPDYKFEDITGRTCSLKELKGLVIYIDVWATWCGPCHHQRKYFEKLIDLYKEEKDLVFVGISLDKPAEKTAWKEMVQNRSIQGIQLIAKNGFKSRFAQDFNIWGIPRFLIIGRDGEIINADALRPSAENIHEILDKALRKGEVINMD